MLRIALIYPEMLGTYGDGGNALVLRERARRRGTDAEVVTVALADALPNASIDVLVGRHAAPVLAETLTNAAVVQLAEAGLGADAIVAKIRASATRFDVSTDAMVALERDAVPDAVIAAMVTAAAGGAPGYGADQSDSADPAALHAPGVYLLQSMPAPRMQRLDPTLADDTKVSSVLGWMLTYGLAPLKVTTVLDSPTAHFRADTSRPTFYFYFNQPGSGLYRNGLGTMRLAGPAPSPDEFTLVQFHVVGDERQAITQQLGVGVRNGGVSAQVPFSYTRVSPGVFAVTPDADLAPGEYAFMVTPADGDGDGDAQSRYFDFSTAGAPAAEAAQ